LGLTAAKINNIHHWKIILFQIIAFSLPLAPKILPVLIFALLILWIYEKGFSAKWNYFKSNKLNFLLPSFYILYMIGIFWSENLGYALSDIEIKLSLFLLPVIILSESLDQKTVNKVFDRFVEGCIITLSLLLVNAAVISYNLLDTKYFFYSNFAVHLHPSYLALYFNSAILFLLYKIFIIRSSWKDKILLIISICFILAGVLMLLSKTGIISLIISFGAGTAFFINQKRYLVGIVAVVAVLMVSAAFIVFPGFNQRFYDLKLFFNGKEKQQDVTSTSIRKNVWDASIKIISTNPIIGVGTGDVKDVLLKEYEKLGFEKALDVKLNAHNQFLQTAVSLGILGLLVLLSSLLIPLISAFRRGDYVFMLLFGLLIFNFFTESMLERQAGVIFFSFFITLFLSKHNQKIID
jgi:O-antigen ligase